MADRRGVGLLDAYRQYVGDPFASMVGGAARGYLGLDKPTYANEEAYRTAQAIGNMPGFGAPAGIFKAAANAPEVIAALGGLLGKPGVGKLAQSAPKMKAPQDEALEFARKNAVKMLGLPENNTAMDRARTMGFDVEGFHGTNKDFPAFKADMAGKSDYGTIGQGVYIDPSKNAAYSNLVTRIIAKEGGGNVMPLMARSGNVFDAADLPLIHNAERSKAVTDNLKALGFDSVLSKVDGKPSEMVVFDPSRIRSRFAAFDPARAKENDLLGFADPRLLALIAAGTGGGLLGYNYSQDR